MAIEAISGGVTGIPAATRPESAAQTGGLGGSFERLLDAAAQSDREADGAVGRMLDGSGDVPEAMIALQQADLMLQFTVQVRNKLVQAYQDIMRMPV